MSKVKRTPVLAKDSWKKSWGKYWQLYLLMLLPIIYFILFKYAPMFGNIIAFRRYRAGMGPFGTGELTLRYFEMFIKDPQFWRALKNTVVLSLLNLLVNFPVPILFAILLNEVRGKRFKKLVQTMSYMPRFMSTVVVIAMLSELLSPSSGIINSLITNLFGVDPIYFVNEPEYFRWIYILTDAWQFTGWTAIIYLAAITGISSDLFEAAEIDGASKLQQIWYVTLPSIMPTIMVMLILSVGKMLTLGFEKVLLLYTPNNAPVSDIIDTLVYRTGLGNMANYSYATAIGLFSGVIGVVLVASSNAISKKLTGESVY